MRVLEHNNENAMQSRGEAGLILHLAVKNKIKGEKKLILIGRIWDMLE